MKSIKFSAAAIITLVVFTLFLIACPELEEDGEIYEEEENIELIKKEGSLDDIMWMETLSEIEKNGKYVNLDLSECTTPVTGKVLHLLEVDGLDYVTFNPLPDVSTGKKYIVSITIPVVVEMIDTAVPVDSFTYTMKIEQEIIDASAFRHFDNLRSVTGKRIEIIGCFAFYDRKTLKEVNFPNVHRVLQGSFYGCAGLEEVSFSAAMSVSIRSFENCTSLKTVYIPTLGADAGLLDAGAFKNCTSLTSIYSQYIRQIDLEAFMGCTSLTEAVFPAAEVIGTEAFRDCASLKRAAFLKVGVPISFAPNAFRGCKSLSELDVRYSYSVSFAAGALSDIGEHLNLLLYDEDDATTPAVCDGHPQADGFLGGEGKGPLTLKTIRFHLPWIMDHENVSRIINEGIVADLENYYKTVKIEIQRRMPFVPSTP